MQNFKKGSNLNELLLATPKGVVLTSELLKKFGINRGMIYHYVHNLNLFQTLGRGVFKKKDDPINWEGIVYSLQFSNEDIHVGGLTALNLLGMTHFIRFNCPVHLFSSRINKTPQWVKSFKKTEIKLFNDSFLKTNKGFIDYDVGLFKIKISSAERAVLEYLYLCPSKVSIKEIYQIMEGARNLRPKLLQVLLENSTSIKVNRLFLFLAERFNHSWFQFLDVSKINLGSKNSKISIVSGGKFDKKYNITLPKDIMII
jgi:hypothetical protein